MRYEGIIFDLDGTLVDSLQDIAYSMNQVLLKHDLPQYDLATYRYFIGEGIKNLVRKALSEAQRNEKAVAKFLEEMVEEYSKHCLDQTLPYEGIEQMLDALTDRKLKLAILSNKVDKLTQLIASKLLAQWEFVEIMGSREDIPRKPDPTAALLISKKLEVSPEKIIFVGDTGIDMETAKEAGMYAVGVSWGYRDVEKLIDNGSDQIITNPMDLINILD